MNTQLLSPRYRLLSPALDNFIHHNNATNLLNALEQFQNPDGGFGHGIEPDIQMPHSNVASTNVVVHVLEDIIDEDLTLPMIKNIVSYFESVFQEKTLSFEMVPPQIADYPHAIWWNYEGLESFTFGNPNPEIAGFLFQYRHLLSSFPLDAFVRKVILHLYEIPDNDVQMHVLLSYLMFYKRVDKDIQAQIRPRLETLLAVVLETDPTAWNGYVLEPYKVYRIAPEFMEPYQNILAENIQLKKEQFDVGSLQPPWTWNQYEDVFEQVKNDWVVWMRYDIMRVINEYEKQ